MSRTRGYATYRGRSPVWKSVLAVVLLSVILASGGVIFLQRRLGAFDGLKEDPSPSADPDGPGLPEISIGGPDDEDEEGPPPEEGTADPDASEDEGAVQDPTPVQAPAPAGTRGYRVQAAPFYPAVYWDMEAIVSRGGYDAVAVTLKDDTGTVWFDAASVPLGRRGARDDTADALQLLTASPRRSIARLSCFKGPDMGNDDMDLVDTYGLKNTGGFIFYDGYGHNWLDPSKPAVRQYLCGLAQEIAALGFDELLLTDVGYPTVGKLDKIAYGDAPMEEQLSLFLAEMRATVSPYGVSLSVEMPRSAVLGNGDGSGLSLAAAAPSVDRIYAWIEPENIATAERAVSALRDGAVAFVPELWSVPDPAPAYYLLTTS